MHLILTKASDAYRRRNSSARRLFGMSAGFPAFFEKGVLMKLKQVMATIHDRATTNGVRLMTFGAAIAALLLTIGPVADAAVVVGSSTLINTLEYSDTFTITSEGGATGRPGGGAFPVGSPGINVENNYGNPARVWTDGMWSINEDSNVSDPGAVYVGSGAGSSTGLTQTGGGVDYGIEYGLRNNFVVQFDAFQSPDRIDITANATRDTIASGGNGLSVFFRTTGNVFPEIGLYNGLSEVSTGLTSGIASINAWHNYAVHFDQLHNKVEIFVDEVSRGVIDLATFNGGSHNTISNAAVSVGGTATTGNRFWSDNVQIGVGQQTAAPVGTTVVLSTDVMLNGGTPATFTDGVSIARGVEIIRNFNGGQSYASNAVPYTSNLAGPTLDLSGFGPILGFQAGNLGANIHGRGGDMFLPGDGETKALNNGGIGFGGHSPWLITFDLQEIRNRFLGDSLADLALTGRFGMNGEGSPNESVSPAGVVQGLIYVDGILQFTSGLKSIADLSDAINLTLDSGDQFLTFAIVAGDGSTFFDDGSFRDMQLTVVPESETVLLFSLGCVGLLLGRLRFSRQAIPRGEVE